MNFDRPERSRGLKNTDMQEPYNRGAEVKRMDEHYQKKNTRIGLSAPLFDARKVEFINSGDRSRPAIPASPKNGKRNFSLESLMVLICLTVSLLILPLILPPLPPPPFILLLLPIGILALLMVLAFMPSEVRDVTHTYM